MPSAAQAIPVMKSRLPLAEAIIPYMQQIDLNEKYCNFGPLEQAFRERLGQRMGVSADEINLFCNGTLALTCALKALELPRDSLCLMPAWTFAATPAAVLMAGLTPYFLDVDEKSWALDPVATARKIRAVPGNIGCVVAVSPFGDPVDIAGWEKFERDTGIRVVIDAAGAYDSFGQVERFYASRIPVMISLHGTKALPIGEGGMVVCRDKAYIKHLKGLTVFGFLNGRNSEFPSLNAKLSEYAAAVGHASLDSYEVTRERYVALRDDYMEQLGALGIAHRLSNHWFSMTCNIVVPGRAKEIAGILAQEGIETRKWWEDGCHRHTAYQHLPHEWLEVTDTLAQSALGIPFFLTMSEEQMQRVIDVLATCAVEPAHHAPADAARFHEYL